MNFRVFKFSIMLILVVFLTVFSHIRQSKSYINLKNIKLIESELKFISNDSVNKLLKQINSNLSTYMKRDLNLKLYENALDDNDLIKKANVSINLENNLQVSLVERDPVFRILNKNSYVDDNGNIMPLSKAFSEKIPIVLGHAKTEDYKKLGVIGSFIKKDSFFNNHISGLKMNHNFLFFHVKNYSYKLKMRFSKNFEKNFLKYKVFYKSVSDSILRNINVINLDFNNQVVVEKQF